MIVADRAPLILDATLQPLEPVLRSNLWLIVHVMTITLSYAAFFLALGISNVALFHVIRGQSVNSPLIRDYVDTCYKSLQVGGFCLLQALFRWGVGGLFVGTFLGMGSERNLGAHRFIGLFSAVTRKTCRIG